MMIFRAEGMNCGSCIKRITAAITALDAGAQVQVDLGAKTVSVSSSLSAAEIMGAMAAAGYPAQAVSA